MNLERLTTPRLLALLRKIRSCDDCRWSERQCHHPSPDAVKAVLADREHVGRVGGQS
jgi:hypothetical protein